MYKFPDNFEPYSCGLCGEHRFFVAKGRFDQQLALQCLDCEEITEIVIQDDALKFKEDF